MYVQSFNVVRMINLLILVIPTEYVYPTTLRFSKWSFSNSYTVTVTKGKC